MLDQEDIEQQLKLLAIHRRTLEHSIRQHKALGVLAPAGLVNGIHECWTNIAQIKAVLRANSVEITDDPDDEPRNLAITIPTLSPLERHNRSRMLQKVREFWIRGVLENSLHGAALIELGMEYKPDAVVHPWDMVVQQPDHQPTRSILPGTKIIDVLDELGGELLILGAPGSGKTTILLELARDLISRAVLDESLPIPIVFNLSSWAEKRKPLIEWLVDELNTRYDVPRKVGKEWVAVDAVLPLLDGLDEVQPDQRVACVDAINAFRQEHGLVNVVVCSRVADYDALAARLRLQFAVLVQPLTPQQIDAYLERAGDQLARLRLALVEDEALQKLSESPLMLSVMTLAYQSPPVEAATAGGTVEDRRKHLFAAYVEWMFMRRGVETHYTQAQTVAWLVLIARGMIASNISQLYIENLQPQSLVLHWRRTYTVVVAFIIGLIGGLMSGLIAGLALGLVGGLQWGLIGGLLLGLSYGGLDRNSMISIVSLRWSWSLVKSMTSGVLRQLWIIEMLLGLGSAFFIGFLFSPIAGFICGTIISLMFGLWVGRDDLISELGYIKISARAKPNQGIWQSFQSALAVGPFVGVILCVPLILFLGGIGIFSGMVAHWWLFKHFMPLTDPSLTLWILDQDRVFLHIGLFWGLGVSILYAMCVGFIDFGGRTCIQHLVLRLILWYSRALPWNFIHFLDFAAKRIFLRKVGGGYIFIHRMLMEYFASLDTPEQEHNATPSR